MAPTRFFFDPARSRVGFSVRHLLVAKVHGRLAIARGTLDYDEHDPLTARAEVELDADSLDTGDRTRDDQLRAPELLGVERHPRVSFASARVASAGAGRHRMEGTLTIRGTARPITLEVETRRAPGPGRLAFSARAVFSRKEFGLVFSAAIEAAGGVAAGDKVEVTIEVEAAAETPPV